MHDPLTSSILLLALVAALAPVAAAPPDTATPEQVLFFEQKIRPVLAEHCYACHSDKAAKLKANLRLDSREALLKGGDNGPVISPGKPEQSPLIKAITYRDPDLEMPPKKKLPDQVVADLTLWVKTGAPWPQKQAVIAPETAAKSFDWARLRDEHWAYRPVKKPELPTVAGKTWMKSPIDAFVLAKLESAGLSPSKQAEKRVLIRRAYLDLTGLPPTPTEVDAFLKDDRPGAFADVIDRLLESPHYGERWARHWLDVARYSDGLGGFLDGQPLPHAWQYRDWVVRAFNRDLPFDQFAQQQIAGDLIEGGEAVATGFFAVGPTYVSDGGDPEATAQAKAETLADRVDTYSRAFLALTVQCARCHDHMFDPIPQMDYYSIAGVFNNSNLIEKPLATAEEVRKYDDHQKAIKDREQAIQKWTAETKKAGGGNIPDDKQPELKRMQTELTDLKASAPPKYALAHALADSGTADMHVAIRGDLRRAGELAPRRFIRIVQGADPPRFAKGSGRLDLARATTDPTNPLVSRVMVNRIWQHHFGNALVSTPSNFGRLGQPPTHPQLLDWLAATFIEQGWSIKRMHRTIMLSATYQMASAHDEAGFRKDGDNKLLWRMSPRRLEIEAWRDSILAVTGELDRTVGGEPVQDILSSRRRTIYAIISRNGDRFASDEFLRLFDFPAPRSSIEQRTTSTVPQQHLFMMNSPFMLQRAKALATRLAKEAADDERRLRLAYELLYARPPSPKEAAVGLEYLKNTPDNAAAWAQYAQILLSAQEFMQVQ